MLIMPDALDILQICVVQWRAQEREMTRNYDRFNSRTNSSKNKLFSVFTRSAHHHTFLLCVCVSFSYGCCRALATEAIRNIKRNDTKFHVSCQFHILIPYSIYPVDRVLIKKGAQSGRRVKKDSYTLSIQYRETINE